jgi:hypothetical protein
MPRSACRSARGEAWQSLNQPLPLGPKVPLSAITRSFDVGELRRIGSSSPKSRSMKSMRIQPFQRSSTIAQQENLSFASEPSQIFRARIAD